MPEIISDHACSALKAGSGAVVAGMHHQWTRSIRALQPAEIDCFGRHLCRLETDCRRSRFGLSVPDVFLRDYAGSVDFANTAVFGCFADNEMRGACELRSLQSLWCGEAELAFSVEKTWRGQGIGTAMMTQAIRTARSLGIDRLYLTCHRHNRSMQCIAGKFTSKITYEDSECFADIAVHCQPMSPLLDAGDGSDRAARKMVILDL
jgi:GNAT superfamily N-acetyltransferase